MKRARFAGLLAVLSCGEVTTNGNDNPPPTIESISPDRGGVPGGHTITVTGSGFTDSDAGDNHVIVGEIIASDVVAEDDATLTFTLPPGPAPDAVLDVTVFNNNGFAVMPDAVQYSPYPTLLSLSQSFVRSTGDDISVFGTGFEEFDAGDNVVTIGGIEAASVEVVSDTELAIEVAPRPDDVPAFQPLDVVVANRNGTVTLPGAFKYTKQGLLRFDWNRNSLTTIYFMDIDDDEVEEFVIATANTSVDSVTLANSGLIYALSGSPSRGFPRSLQTVNPLTGAVQFIGAFELPVIPDVGQEDIRKITFNNGKLYGMLRYGRQLVEIDPDDASYNTIGAASSYPEVPQFGIPLGMGRRNDSSMWVGHSISGTLYQVNTANSTTTPGPTLLGETPAGFYDIVTTGGKTYATTRGSAVVGEVGATLIEIDTSTGAITPLYQFIGNHSTIVQTPPLF